MLLVEPIAARDPLMPQESFGFSDYHRINSFENRHLDDKKRRFEDKIKTNLRQRACGDGLSAIIAHKRVQQHEEAKAIISVMNRL